MIEVKNLTKKFGNFTAVDNISLKVNKGEIFAFLGPNGAGKTTTIKMLTTLLKPTSGEIYLDHHNVVENQDATRKSIGIVFQDPSLDNELTAYENMQFHAILYGLKKEIYRQRIIDLLKLVELYDKKDAFVKNFSGGMKRRLEIARGLLHLPKVLFLDEPTLGLDPQTRNHIWTHISGLNQKEQVTVFLTTHHMEEVERMANRVAIIDHGKIIIEGTIEEIINKAETKNLEDAFIKLTGSSIRDEQGNAGVKSDENKSKANALTSMTAIYILWLRQLKRFVRTKSRIIGAIGQPIIFLLAFGFGLSPIFQAAGAGNYIQFLAPGIIVMTVLFTSIFTGLEIIWDKQFGFLKETFVAPVPRYQILLGKVLGGATVAMIQGVLVFIITLVAGFRPIHWSSLPIAFLYLFLVAFLSSALGAAISARLEDMQGFPLIFNFVVQPLFFLSGAIFPLQNLPWLLNIITKINPFSYGVDGLRYAFSGVSVFSPVLSISVLIAVSLVILAIGIYQFSKVQL